MRQIWAPWRMKYINADRDGTCFLCRAIQAPERDEENLVLVRRGKALIMLNRFPYNNGHLMVAPTAHAGAPEDVPVQQMSDTFDLVILGKKILDRALGPQGYNLGCNLGTVAGAGLPEHLHIHIVPRWAGDTNFMPVVASARVISEALEETFRSLKEAHEAIVRAE